MGKQERVQHAPSEVEIRAALESDIRQALLQFVGQPWSVATRHQIAATLFQLLRGLRPLTETLEVRIQKENVYFELDSHAFILECAKLLVTPQEVKRCFALLPLFMLKTPSLEDNPTHTPYWSQLIEEVRRKLLSP